MKVSLWLYHDDSGQLNIFRTVEEGKAYFGDGSQYDKEGERRTEWCHGLIEREDYLTGPQPIEHWTYTVHEFIRDKYGNPDGSKGQWRVRPVFSLYHYVLDNPVVTDAQA